MRDSQGKFVKGVSASPKTQFQKGEHWRPHQKFREKDWLWQKYVEEELSMGDIASMFNVTEGAIKFWLDKHQIPKRTVQEARQVKKWGLDGPDNPMWNKKGELNHNWKGGVTPERQSFYMSREWKDACSFVWQRDQATCQRCGLNKKEQRDMPFHIHHIISFENKELRAKTGNLALLCECCHQFVHSRRNKANEFIR